MMTGPRWLLGGVLLLLLLAAWVLTQPFFPGPSGLGHDYAYFLPELLSNYYWSLGSAPWVPPWFSPAFCGGQPAFPDPQSGYFSLPQWLVVWWDPVTAIHLTTVLMMVLGFAGGYRLLRDGFQSSRDAALLGATVFAFNGFFLHRMLIGHLSFHGVMLTPWLGWALLAPVSRGRPRWLDAVAYGLPGSLVVAYWVYSGMLVMLLPAGLAVLMLVVLHRLSGRVAEGLWLRGAYIAVFGVTLSAWKLNAVLEYVAQVPRTHLPLQGFSGLGESVLFSVSALFLGASHALGLSEQALMFSRHEFEYGVTAVPAVLLLGAGLLVLPKMVQARPWRSPRLMACAAILALLLLLPVAFNANLGPAWHDVLKSLPVIRHSSTLIRWNFAFIPLVMVVCALAFERLTVALTVRQRTVLLGAALAGTVFAQGVVDRLFYLQQSYDPQTIQAAFLQARQPGFAPAVERQEATLDAQGRVVLTGNRNDALARGAGAAYCYNAIFGYGLEKLPVEVLHPGPVNEVMQGVLNVKNPACYVFPKENHCWPGAHFPQEDVERAEAFVRYQAFPFRTSNRQQIAATLSLLAALASLAGALACLLHRRMRARHSAPASF